MFFWVFSPLLKYSIYNLIELAVQRICFNPVTSHQKVVSFAFELKLTVRKCWLSLSPQTLNPR